MWEVDLQIMRDNEMDLRTLRDVNIEFQRSSIAYKYQIGNFYVTDFFMRSEIFSCSRIILTEIWNFLQNKNYSCWTINILKRSEFLNLHKSRNTQSREFLSGSQQINQ